MILFTYEVDFYEVLGWYTLDTVRNDLIEEAWKVFYNEDLPMYLVYDVDDSVEASVELDGTTIKVTIIKPQAGGE